MMKLTGGKTNEIPLEIVVLAVRASDVIYLWETLCLGELCSLQLDFSLGGRQMSKYGFVNKPIKVTQKEWDRIFNSPLVLCLNPSTGSMRAEKMEKCRHCGEYFDPEATVMSDCPGSNFAHQTWEESPNEITVRIPEERPSNAK